LPWPQGNPFELVGRLSTPESFIVLGRDADRIRTVADLRGMRIGIGPVGSGTEVVARQVLAQLPGLDLKVSTQSVESQLTMLERGELDLAAMVIDADAQLMVEAVRDRKLQIVDIAGADALAHRLAFARAGRITASYYDAVSNLPPVDKRVIQVDALVIGNGCARESVTQGVITAFVRIFPDFVRVNRESPNLTGLPVASAARTYYENDGPDTVGTYVPWFIDIMPTARWVQAIFLISLLFGAQAAWHRFRLWRIDARRVVIEGKVLRLFGPGVTVSEIETMAPEARHTEPAACAMLQKTIDELGEPCGALPAAIGVAAGADGAGDGLQDPGRTDRRSPARAQALSRTSSPIGRDHAPASWWNAPHSFPGADSRLRDRARRLRRPASGQCADRHPGPHQGIQAAARQGRPRQPRGRAGHPDLVGRRHARCGVGLWNDGSAA
jgi:hypothetical protein